MGIVIKQYVRAGYGILPASIRKIIRYRWQRIWFGKDETSPILQTEFILRRIHRNNYDASLPTPVKRPAFEPNEYDTDGISLHRELFISAKTLAWCGRQPGHYYVARFSIQELMDEPLKLNAVAASDIDQPAGHSVIPELKAGSKTKKTQKQLADMASSRIVYKAPRLPAPKTAPPKIEPLQ